MSTDSEQESQELYQIIIRGRLEERWSEWFGRLKVVVQDDLDESPLTRLIGPVSDQAALRGILTRIWDLNLEVISVNRVSASPENDAFEVYKKDSQL